jgi:hypothetical protein
MKSAWVRFVFVLCTLSAILYVFAGVACMWTCDGRLIHPFASDAPEVAGIFSGLLLVNVVVVATLHIISFIVTGNTGHIECMFAWLLPPFAVAGVCLHCGESIEKGWGTAFAIPCNPAAYFCLALGTGAFIANVVYGGYYGKLTSRP